MPLDGASSTDPENAKPRARGATRLVGPVPLEGSLRTHRVNVPCRRSSRKSRTDARRVCNGYSGKTTPADRRRQPAAAHRSRLGALDRDALREALTRSGGTRSFPRSPLAGLRRPPAAASGADGGSPSSPVAPSQARKREARRALQRPAGAAAGGRRGKTAQGGARCGGQRWRTSRARQRRCGGGGALSRVPGLPALQEGRGSPAAVAGRRGFLSLAAGERRR